jgi:hypothetical protein
LLGNNIFNLYIIYSARTRGHIGSRSFSNCSEDYKNIEGKFSTRNNFFVSRYFEVFFAVTFIPFYIFSIDLKQLARFNHSQNCVSCVFSHEMFSALRSFHYFLIVYRHTFTKVDSTGNVLLFSRCMHTFVLRLFPSILSIFSAF